RRGPGRRCACRRRLQRRGREVRSAQAGWPAGRSGGWVGKSWHTGGCENSRIVPRANRVATRHAGTLACDMRLYIAASFHLRLARGAEPCRGQPLIDHRPGSAPGLKRSMHMSDPRELESKFWKALKSDMTVMLGVDGLEDGHTRPMTAQLEHEARERKSVA